MELFHLSLQCGVVIDAVVAEQLNTLVDQFAARVPPSFLECARKGRQVMDITFPMSLVIEKGLDCRSQACVAQQDVKQYYDHLQAMKIADWILRHFSCSGLAATFVRLHCCPSIRLQVGSRVATFQNRSIGLNTGSRSAAAAGRIPLLDIASDRLSLWTRTCFSQNGCACALATFVDNLVSAGPSPEATIQIMEDCTDALSARWQLTIGCDSKEYMVCKGYPHGIHVPNGWQPRGTLKMLGHHLDKMVVLQVVSSTFPQQCFVVFMEICATAYVGRARRQNTDSCGHPSNR